MKIYTTDLYHFPRNSSCNDVIRRNSPRVLKPDQQKIDDRLKTSSKQLGMSVCKFAITLRDITKIKKVLKRKLMNISCQNKYPVS